jgi:hypothetical protein
MARRGELGTMGPGQGLILVARLQLQESPLLDRMDPEQVYHPVRHPLGCVSGTEVAIVRLCASEKVIGFFLLRPCLFSEGGPLLREMWCGSELGGLGHSEPVIQEGQQETSLCQGERNRNGNLAVFVTEIPSLAPSVTRSQRIQTRYHDIMKMRKTYRYIVVEKE